MQERQRNIIHDAIKQEVLVFCISNGLYARVSNQLTSSESMVQTTPSKRPDIEVIGLLKILLLAATVVPSLESNLTLPHASIQGHAATQAKKLKYQHVCTTAGYGFIPLAMENRGLSNEFKDF